MSIELAAPPSPQPKAATAGLGANGKLKTGAQEGASLDNTGSFSALLAASAGEVADPEPAAAKDALRIGAKEDDSLTVLSANPPALDLAALLALAGQADAVRASAGTATMPTVSDSKTSDPEPTAAQDGAKEDAPFHRLPANPPAPDLAALLALAGQADAVRASAGAAVVSNSTGIVTANVVAMPMLADVRTSGPMAHRATVAGGKNGLPTVTPEEVTASVLGGPAAGAAAKGPLLAGKNAGTNPPAVSSDPADSRQLAASVARAAEKLETHGARLEAFSREPALAGLLVASGLGDGLVRPSGANSDKPSGRLAVASFEGSGGAMQAATGSPGEVMVPPEVVTVQTTDTLLADTVSYWVSQGVQKAELKLDGFGAEPIEVSISLANGEAQIGFRTDRADVREVIEGAISHLKEQLASEGLVLAGVSVGTSGQDRAGAQAQRERTGARQKGVSLVEPNVAPAAPRARAVTGRSVDLFV